jgi:Cu(I)/Ag(I) efflux system membrane protein CusA/SilA
MIKKIIAWSARRKYFVILITFLAVLASVWTMKHVALDAIPDLSDTQVIVFSRWDRSPDVIEDQVTYPLVTALLGAPRVKAIRGFSDFGFSYVYVIFEDGTDLYWARNRVQEYLSKIHGKLPEGVQTELGPDATSVGWVYQYALVDKSGRRDLADLRDIQDWSLRYWLQSVPGVAEVASVGGFQKQYQVQVDPNTLAAAHIPLMNVVEALRDNNNDFGGRMIEMSGAEYMIRGRGYARSLSDIENIAIQTVSPPRAAKRDSHSGVPAAAPQGTRPLLIKNIGRVALGPDIRRGVCDLDGIGETVGGIVIMRQGENALQVINRVKGKIREIAPALPEGVEIVPTYDRSDFIRQALHTLRHELIVQMILVSLIILVFLWHAPSAITPIVTIPVSVALSFIPLYLMGLTANIMSLAGIAISIGVLVDGAIIEVENAYKRLEQWTEAGRPGDFHAVRLRALQEVAPSVFFSLLTIAVAFLPVLALGGQEGRLFKPLALTKNSIMAIAAVLAITFDPAVRMTFTRPDPFSFSPRWLCRVVNQLAVGRYVPEERHPLSRRLFRVYEPACRFVLKRPRQTLGAALLIVLATLPLYGRLGSEFMPPLDEGTLLYMPSTLPGLSIGEAARLLTTQDRILKSFPEVERVFGKAGRADTATDPAPLSMMETTALLKPVSQWPVVKRWWGGSRRLSKEELIDQLNRALQIPGVSNNAWTMPIKARTDMLSTGIGSPVGIKILGPDLQVIERIGAQLEGLLREVPGARSVFAERATGGYFLDFDLRRDRLAQYGISVKDVEMVMASAIGGEPITTTVEGSARHTVSLRLAREFRDSVSRLGRVTVHAPSGADIPLADLADIQIRTGPAMIRDEEGMRCGYVTIDISGRDVGGWVREARQKVSGNFRLPEGYALLWSGQYENILRARDRLKIVVPLTFCLIAFLLFMNTGSLVKTGIVLLAVPFSMVGAIWYLTLLGYHVSVAVWAGLVALMGLDAETGVFMLLFLDLAYEEAVQKGRMRSPEDLTEAIVQGAVKRVRPKMMTVSAALIGLFPIMWSAGLGADVMRRIAAPLIGGLLTSFLLELLVYPPIYSLWKRRKLTVKI